MLSKEEKIFTAQQESFRKFVCCTKHNFREIAICAYTLCEKNQNVFDLSFDFFFGLEPPSVVGTQINFIKYF